MAGLALLCLHVIALQSEFKQHTECRERGKDSKVSSWTLLYETNTACSTIGCSGLTHLVLVMLNTPLRGEILHTLILENTALSNAENVELH